MIMLQEKSITEEISSILKEAKAHKKRFAFWKTIVRISFGCHFLGFLAMLSKMVVRAAIPNQYSKTQHLLSTLIILAWFVIWLIANLIADKKMRRIVNETGKLKSRFQDFNIPEKDF